MFGSGRLQNLKLRNRRKGKPDWYDPGILIVPRNMVLITLTSPYGRPRRYCVSLALAALIQASLAAAKKRREKGGA